VWAERNRFDFLAAYKSDKKVGKLKGGQKKKKRRRRGEALLLSRGRARKHKINLGKKYIEINSLDYWRKNFIQREIATWGIEQFIYIYICSNWFCSPSTFPKEKTFSSR